MIYNLMKNKSKIGGNFFILLNLKKWVGPLPVADP